MPRLMIVIASTRPGRVGLPVAEWFTGRAEAHGGFEIDVADLAEIALPFMDEPKHPRFGDYEHQHTKDWSARVAAADAFVFVTPEYNYSFNAPLKNAIDFLHNEWNHKPAGMVGYGGVAAGTRAIVALSTVLGPLRVRVAQAQVTIPFVAKRIGEDGTLDANEIMEGAADAMLDELVELEHTLRPLRT